MNSSSNWSRGRSFVRTPGAEDCRESIAEARAVKFPVEYIALTLGMVFISAILAWAASLR